MQFKSIVTAAVMATLAFSSFSSFAQGYDKSGKVIIVQKNQRQHYYNARGPEFVRGRALPRDLRTPQYVVANYRQHHLTAPRRGQQWVQVGADYVLVSIATGVIASIVLSR